ncbi:MAG: thiol-disulfide oxidoreductase DCC family protein [Hyphomonadaceae bacterium]
MNEPALLLYDGDCSLCAHSVQFLAPRDTRARLRFAAIAGPHGRAHAQAAGIDPGAPSSILLVLDGKHYIKSEASLRAARLIKAPWPFLARLGQLVPRVIRDAAYDFVAKRRYAFFGRACLVPDPAWADRVLD